jgi:hypothetical protein
MYRWVAASGGAIPEGAQPQGYEATGESLWVCRANLNGGVHPGKVRGAFGAANIPWGGQEVKVFEYEVLMEEGEWVDSSGGNIPDGAAAWGHEANGEGLFVARAVVIGEDLHPGKVRGEFGAANIPYGGQEVKVQFYQVLVGE